MGVATKGLHGLMTTIRSEMLNAMQGLTPKAEARFPGAKWSLENRKKSDRVVLEWPAIAQSFRRILNRYGAVKTHVDALGFEGTSNMWIAAQELVKTLPSMDSLRGEGDRAEDDLTAHCVHADAALIATDHADILRWGLNDRLLDLVEQYLETPPACIGVALRKDSPDGQQVGTRLWHVDGEDTNVFKVLVYLNDVGEKNGPFEYVPKDCFNPRRRRWSFRYHWFWRYFCKDQDIAKLVPKSQWEAATGPAGTAVLVDTTSVFHHGAIAQEGERLVLIFAYTSQNPKDMELCKKFFPRADLLPALGATLSPRQRDCLLHWRGLRAEQSLAS